MGLRRVQLPLQPKQRLISVLAAMDMETHQWNDCMAVKLKMKKTHKRNKMSDMQRLGRWVDSYIDGLFIGLQDILKGFTTVSRSV